MHPAGCENQYDKQIYLDFYLEVSNSRDQVKAPLVRRKHSKLFYNTV